MFYPAHLYLDPLMLVLLFRTFFCKLGVREFHILAFPIFVISLVFHSIKCDFVMQEEHSRDRYFTIFALEYYLHYTLAIVYLFLYVGLIMFFTIDFVVYCFATPLQREYIYTEPFGSVSHKLFITSLTVQTKSSFNFNDMKRSLTTTYTPDYDSKKISSKVQTKLAIYSGNTRSSRSSTFNTSKNSTLDKRNRDKKFKEKKDLIQGLQLQTSPEDAFSSAYKKFCINFIPQKDILVSLITGDPNITYETVMRKHGHMVKLVEDLGLLCIDFSLCKNKKDIALSVLRFAKMRSTGPLIASTLYSSLDACVRSIFFEMSFSVQSEIEDQMSDLRGVLDDYEHVKRSPMYKKFYRFMMYALSLSIFDGVGLSFESVGYQKLEADALKRQFHMGPDFIHCVADTILFLCERGHQCFKTGSLDPLFHSGDSYGKWFDASHILLRQYQKIGRPEEMGISRHEFRSNLEMLIDKGQAIYIRAKKIGDYEARQVNRMLANLEMIRFDERTFDITASMRNPPFTILLNGESGIGKSTIVDNLFYLYSGINKLPTENINKYVRRGTEKHWNNFKSSAHTVIFDDVAFMNPNYAPNGDPTVLEFLNVINPIPFTPDQASLEDKGKNPFLAEFVIATTNTKHLNTGKYFAHPTAINRRFPFVITPSVKPEYQKKDSHALDSSKTIDVPGRFSDFWTFKIETCAPQLIANKSLGNAPQFIVLHEALSTDEFVAWFIETQKKHKEDLKIMKSSLNNVRSISYCEKCQYPDYLCICEQQVQSIASTFYTSLLFTNILILSVNAYLSLYWKYSLWRKFSDYMLHIDVIKERCRLLANRYAQVAQQPFQRNFWVNLGERVNHSIGENRYRTAAILFTSIVSIGIFTKYLFRQFKGDLQSSADEMKLPATSIEGRPKPNTEERYNPWYKEEMSLSTYDLTPQIVSWKNMSNTEVIERISDNVVYIIAETSQKIRARILCLKGQLFMTNNHIIPPDGKVKLTLIEHHQQDGVSYNRTVYLDQNEITRDVKSDLCFFTLRNTVPRKDITGLFPKESFNVSLNGTYVSRSPEGEVFTLPVLAMKKNINVPITSINACPNLWLGTTKSLEDTQTNFCGSVLLGESYYGNVILGLHVLGGKDARVGCLSVTQEYLSPFLELDMYQVQSGPPMFHKDHKNIGPLSKKSVFRYIDKGVAKIYGSYDGSRPNHKSCVQNTLISSSLAYRGYDFKYTAPNMRGYEPWRIAAIPMVNTSNLFNETLLRECKQNFMEDILDRLSNDDLSELQVFDEFTSLNGAAGVTYIDKINRNTSCGYPYMGSKKKFLYPIPPVDGLQEPVGITEEIKSRVDVMEANYKKGVRNRLIYVAHLKDEAVTHAKAQIGKTRVFTGMPFDGCILVRKYFLATTRLIQKNRFIFEAAPGTIAQSSEWGDIYKYLTHFGKERIIAGDYKEFDKRMFASVILLAFEILTELNKRSGNYSEEQLRACRAISMDIAFPNILFNGDLVEFIGTNPSGHPLTVIINSLVNSIYMRYAYAVASPLKNCKFFKRDVRLMTYGDDNTAGVSDDAPFFTHTAIQKILGDVGVVYTMADKVSESVPYIHISEVEFLKRSFVYDDDVGAILCPLNHDSIEKMLMTWTRSKTITREEQAIAVISSAVYEYFFYGRDVFEEKVALLQKIVKENDLEFFVQDSTFPTWEALKERFHNAKPDCAEVKVLSLQACEVYYSFMTRSLHYVKNLISRN